ncbi:MAG: hypothetical protein IKO52_00285, partial [Clostridia bacterium]|nr:hypothetical protein [Clostridia bacterium]
DGMRPTKWLVNVIMGKHADMMDAYPEPVILAREESDEAQAKILTSVLPVILEQNHFKDEYRLQAWEKNKHGTAAYAVYWDASKLNGMGDIAVVGVDLMNLFWEPGISDIQESRNVFFVSAVDKETLKEQYPQLTNANLEQDFSMGEYDTESKAPRTDKALVVDWYYHTKAEGQSVLQYCKYVGLHVLYASEDDPNVKGGWYEDGKYPFVLDRLFPQKESPAGWGYIDLGKDAQEDIDQMDHAIVINARAGAIPRYFRKTDSPINQEQFLNFSTPVVEVEGGLNEADMVPIQHKQLDGIYVTYLNNKIEELKQTCGNQDVTNGISSGVTAASGIAAQMEAAGRTSRDGNDGTYSAYTKLLEMVIERIRQFYDMPRTFRIVGERSANEYVSFDNSGLIMQQNAPIAGQEMGWRKPVFDIEVSAQKANAYTKMAQNELALQLLKAGVFNPQMIVQSMMLLDCMDFKGKDEIKRKLQEMGGMQQQLIMWQQMALKLASKYEPQTAEEMAAGIMGQPGAAQAEGAQAESRKPPAMGVPGTDDAAHMIKAREYARDVSQPNT